MGKSILWAFALWSSLAAASTYYVDSVGGNDANSGLSTARAIKSLSKASSLNLQPGDSVLFKRGEIFKGTLTIKNSGTASARIVYSAYGSGSLPLISGYNVKAYGIDGQNKNGITVQNLAITEVTNSGIVLQRSTDWTIYNVRIAHTGGPSLFGAIHCGGKATSMDQFPGCKRVFINHVTIQDTSGEGIYFSAAERITISDSVIELSQGATADNIQVSYSRDVAITGNDLSQEGSSTGKGNICLCNTFKAIYYPTNSVTGNSLAGGNFGLSAYGDGIVINGNDFSNHTAQSWSTDIVSSDGTSSIGITITNNLFSESNYGVTVGGTAASDVRQNFQISDNLFNLVKTGGIHIYTTKVTGEANNNTLYTTASNVQLLDNASSLSHAGNASVKTPPKIVPVDVSGAGAH